MTTNQESAADSILSIAIDSLPVPRPVLSALQEAADAHPVHLCPQAAAKGEFSLQLEMHRNRKGEAEAAMQMLLLLPTLMGSLLVRPLEVTILEYSYGQYAQFKLVVNEEASHYQVLKTMNGRTWALAESTSLLDVLEFVQRCVYRADDDQGLSTR